MIIYRKVGFYDGTDWQSVSAHYSTHSDIAITLKYRSGNLNVIKVCW